LRFYDVDDTVAGAMEKPESEVRLRVAIDFSGDGEFVEIEEDLILEGTFRSYREAEGGVVNRGTMIFDNANGAFSPERFGEYLPAVGRYNGLRQEDGLGNLRPGRRVRISFTVGSGELFVPRFLLHVDERGFRNELSDCCRDQVIVGLVDLSYYLAKSREAADWTEETVFTYMRVCDKEFPLQSLVHRIAARGGLSTADIDCSTIAAELPYLKASLSVWQELSACARAYRAHLETAVEKPLVFAHSPYQEEDEESRTIEYVLGNGNLFSLRSEDSWGEFRNDIRLKWNKCLPQPRQRLWHYADPPVEYGEDLSPHYPFSAAGRKREIESETVEYTALYTASGDDGRERTVVYADELDTLADLEARMVIDGPALEIASYNPDRYPDRAVIRLSCSADTMLEELSIWGRPIAVEPNFACFKRNEESIALYGTRALDVTGGYFSDTLYDGVPHYQHWTEATLQRLCRMRKRYVAQTNRGLFHARAGALVKVDETLLGSGIEGRVCEIEGLVFRFRKTKSFVARFELQEA